MRCPPLVVKSRGVVLSLKAVQDFCPTRQTSSGTTADNLDHFEVVRVSSHWSSIKDRMCWSSRIVLGPGLAGLGVRALNDLSELLARAPEPRRGALSGQETAGPKGRQGFLRREPPFGLAKSHFQPSFVNSLLIREVAEELFEHRGSE